MRASGEDGVRKGEQPFPWHGWSAGCPFVNLSTRARKRRSSSAWQPRAGERQGKAGARAALPVLDMMGVKGRLRAAIESRSRRGAQGQGGLSLPSAAAWRISRARLDDPPRKRHGSVSLTRRFHAMASLPPRWAVQCSRPALVLAHRQMSLTGASRAGMERQDVGFVHFCSGSACKKVGWAAHIRAKRRAGGVPGWLGERMR